ncbi:MotA/TolQ/ExbB proton channel family protein [Microbacter margulisiae]|uniref:Biopolymer transport protein ExbB n=1 Tax=Microbacter margulisiae TaxID=1350067 RepID=A0A7W5DPF7_9PORP|nr:MotA/TolQ/ExbB proton channel family protein [Microbacter margulisiae]MBB3185893.1 biopolymer transport protein ExbB [Microbacter margulisiae]
MSKTNQKKQQTLGDALRSTLTIVVMLVALTVSILVFLYVMGNPINFEGGNPAGRPLTGNYLGIIYKGGMIVPLLMTINLVMIIFVIERAISLTIAKGKGRLNVFVKNIQVDLDNDKIEDAIARCDKQRGSLANVLKAGLMRYRELQHVEGMDKDQKIVALQKEFEEATALELPMLSRNLVIISTIASISVLTGLLGTVLGMIRAFAALASSGAPDAIGLSTGISEALVNTAFGIGGSLLAIVFFNYFTTRIDNFTYKIDEAGFTLVQSFAASTK